ncbi:hypothetical protein [Streptosporangium sp. NPDC051022]|uniref:hypothetical protein n=1 Tax=Streptosporangium sp. NPDC051022 TaxID=3155752 RepID=UPI00343541FC
MTVPSTTPLTGFGGGLPPVSPPRDAQITVATRCGARVTTVTWRTCYGVADFITNLLGEPRGKDIP